MTTLRERVEGLVKLWRKRGADDTASGKLENPWVLECADELAAALAAEGPEPRELKVMDGTDWKYDYVRDEAWIDGRQFVPVLTQTERRTGPAAAPSPHKEKLDFGTAEEVIAGLDAINKHNASLAPTNTIRVRRIAKDYQLSEREVNAAINWRRAARPAEKERER